MPELIDRQATLEKIETLCKAYLLHEPAGMGGLSAIKLCKEIVEKQPTIEAEPVRQANAIYIPNSKGYPFCSCCHEEMPFFLNFCPCCGAKMDADGGTISKERFAEIGGADNG